MATVSSRKNCGLAAAPPSVTPYRWLSVDSFESITSRASGKSAAPDSADHTTPKPVRPEKLSVLLFQRQSFSNAR